MKFLRNDMADDWIMHMRLGQSVCAISLTHFFVLTASYYSALNSLKRMKDECTFRTVTLIKLCKSWVSIGFPNVKFFVPYRAKGSDKITV